MDWGPWRSGAKPNSCFKLDWSSNSKTHCKSCPKYKMCDVSDYNRLQREDWIELAMLSWIIHTAHRATNIFFRLYHMHETSVLYAFMKQPCWWSIASKIYSYLNLLEKKHFCIVSVSSRQIFGTSRLEQKIERLGLVSSRSRLGCNVKRLGLGHEGLGHIPAKGLRQN